MAINLLAPLQITRELLPTLLARGDAHILNVCSISGMVAGGRFSAYHTSKFGLVGFTEALRAEYNRQGHRRDESVPGAGEQQFVQPRDQRAEATGAESAAVVVRVAGFGGAAWSARHQEEQTDSAGDAAGQIAVLDEADFAGIVGRAESRQPEEAAGAD